MLQAFNGLDPSLIVATLDSGEYSGQLIRQLWQSWLQSTRDTVLGEVQPEIRDPGFAVTEVLALICFTATIRKQGKYLR